IRFLVLEDSTVSIILGRPWLQQHLPTLRWDPCDITSWSERCYEQCLSNTPRPPPVPDLLSSTQVESPEPEIPPETPAEYMAFQDVFSKQAATHLPPHRPWDCAIEPLSGAQLPKGKVYPLSIPECQAMEEYIEEALKQGFIHGARVFTKLDLRSTYNLVHIREGDEWKTAFVIPTGHYEYWVIPFGLSISPSVFQTFMNEVFREYLHQFVVVYIDDILIYSWNQADHRQHVQQVLKKLRQHSLFLKLENSLDLTSVPKKWPLPNSIKKLQRFLGFASFYRRFIKGYSSITAPLTSLLWGKPRHIIWNPAAHKAFQQLKSIFSTAPVLHHPDPERPFTVEVDTSTIEVGAVLSQAVGESSLLHPSAFYSRKLTLAEQNYDVGSRELLAIKLALEEWCHWLEGATHPFTIINDHKNLQYLREARHLNPRQACWALFLTRFNFTITYRPGSKNIPFSPEAPSEPEPIILSNLIVSPIIWELDREIQQATLQEPTPPEYPEGKTYMPLSPCQTLLGTAHGSGHPGSSRTLSLLQSRYWWPSMHRDTISLTLPVNSLQEGWFHYPSHRGPGPISEWIFFTDLPDSAGNTCILIIVDRFSKSCKLVPLRGLPTAMETAEQLFHQVFILVFQTSHVWKAFFKLLGVSVNLSSGYHPQTNGQTERKIQELGRYLRAYCQDDQHSWSRFLPWAKYTQNSLRQDTTGLTPFQCKLGFQPPLFPWTEEPSNVPAVDHWFREGERVWDSAHHHLQRAVRLHKNFADARRRAAPNYQPGDLVWLSNRDLQLRLPFRKLSPCYIGPFRILRQINEVTEPPPPEVLDQPSVFTVHEILDS
ncbi:hypothetical protein M9458_038575, partial [Cirrhinus mrigala]